jgi:ABC-type lipoprotein export system ATPase subunit
MNDANREMALRKEVLIDARSIVLSPFAEAAPFDFSLRRGEHWLLLGGSRSGKTPLLKTLLGLLSPHAGSVNLFGRDLQAERPSELLKLRRRVGVVFAADGLLPAWSGLENLALPLRYHDALPPKLILERIEEYAARYAIPDLWLEQPVASLSREKRAALSLVRALIVQPELLIIDGIPFDAIEAFSGIKSTRLLDDAIAGDCSVIVSLPQQVGEGLPGFLHKSGFETALMQEGRLQFAALAPPAATPTTAGAASAAPPTDALATLDDHAQATRS